MHNYWEHRSEKTKFRRQERKEGKIKQTHNPRIAQRGRGLSIQSKKEKKMDIKGTATQNLRFSRLEKILHDGTLIQMSLVIRNILDICKRLVSHQLVTQEVATTVECVFFLQVSCRFQCF